MAYAKALNVKTSTGHSRRILVVDDVNEMRALYVEFLTLNGFQVVQAADGRQALDVAFAEQPAAIVMDLDMPVIDGPSATRLLRADWRTKSVPIIVLTGTFLVERLQDVRNLGCEAILRKPCMPEVLLDAIEHVLRGEQVPDYLASA
jgi:two-component system cell cycle response regulator DivK